MCQCILADNMRAYLALDTRGMTTVINPLNCDKLLLQKASGQAINTSRFYGAYCSNYAVKVHCPDGINWALIFRPYTSTSRPKQWSNKLLNYKFMFLNHLTGNHH